MTDLYTRIGGELAVTAAVPLFYERLLADDELAPFFHHVSMEGLIDKQIAFMSWALDGPSKYRGRKLDEAHRDLVKNMGLTGEHFDRTIQHLVDTLVDLDVNGDDVDEIRGRLMGLKGTVMGTE